MSQSKIALLQRQQAFQRDAINNEHEQVKNCKNQIKWLKGVPDIACTQKRIDVLYKCIEASRKRIAKLVEMQKFTKGQLQELYWARPAVWKFKHKPKFMSEAPAAEIGSVVGEEL